MSLFIHRLLLKIQLTSVWQQHLLGTICIIFSLTPILLYWQITKNSDTTTLHNIRLQQLNLKPKIYRTSIVNQTLSKNSHRLNELEQNFNSRPENLIYFISTLPKDWIIKYQKTTSLLTEKTAFKLSITLTAQQLLFCLTLIEQHLAKVEWHTIQVKPTAPNLLFVVMEFSYV